MQMNAPSSNWIEYPHPRSYGSAYLDVPTQKSTRFVYELRMDHVLIRLALVREVRAHSLTQRLIPVASFASRPWMNARDEVGF
jgi:hypothetical protein